MQRICGQVSRMIYNHHKGPLLGQLFCRNLFIKSMPGMNPNYLYVYPGENVVGDQPTKFYKSVKDAQDDPLALNLMKIDGITEILMADIFVYLTKKPELEWDALKPEVFEIITKHYEGSTEIPEDEEDTEVRDGDSENEIMIKELISSKVKPFLARDGGNCRYRGFDEESGFVYVTLLGKCKGCPHSKETLKNGIGKLLEQFVPTVKDVVDIPIHVQPPHLNIPTGI